MDNEISSYVSKLRSQLETQLGPYEARLIAEEVEAHLRDRALAFQELGSEPLEAEREALAVFGSENQLASAFRQPRTLTLSPIMGNIAHLLALAAVVISVNTPPGPYWIGVWAITLFLAVPAFCRRFPWISFALWMALVLVSTFITPLGGVVVFTMTWNLVVALALVVLPFWIGKAVRLLGARLRQRPRGPLTG